MPIPDFTAFNPGYEPRMIPKTGHRFSDKIMRRRKGGEAPKGACQPLSTPHGRGSALIAARSPSGASPQHSPGRSQPALAQLQTRAS